MVIFDFNLRGIFTYFFKVFWPFDLRKILLSELFNLCFYQILGFSISILVLSILPIWSFLNMFMSLTIRELFDFFNSHYSLVLITSA